MSQRRVLPFKRFMGMCRWMGSHFHDWFNYNGFAFSITLLEWGRTFWDFWTKGLFIWARLTGLARLPGWILPWVYMRNFSPVSEMRKGQRSWERVLAPNSGNKANMAKHKNLNFRAYLTIGNSYSSITTVKWNAYDVENTAGNARRCHPDRQNASRQSSR